MIKGNSGHEMFDARVFVVILFFKFSANFKKL
jgi:hypothetical protein